VEHFAQDVKADLITLGSEDFIDLVEHFTGLVPDEGAAPLYSPNPILTNTMACLVNITGF
jgi:hypothetical protein